MTKRLMCGSEPPPRSLGDGGVSMMTKIRGGSNAKAKRELGWQPIDLPDLTARVRRRAWLISYAADEQQICGRRRISMCLATLQSGPLSI